jgi:hypothetical protein
MNELYCIASWHETFERAESRKLKQLHWIALPVDFSSTGYQQLLEDFGPDAAAMYGAWCGLCAFAATCHVRGTLANSRHQPLKLSHIARVTGFPEPIFEQLIAWALRPEIGWLQNVKGEIDVHQPAERTAQPSAAAVPEIPPDVPPTNPQIHGANPQVHNPTEPDRTRHNHSVDRSDIERKWRSAERKFILEVVEMANRFSRLRFHLDRDLIWRACWIAMHFEPGTVHDCLERLRTPDAVSKPKNYLASAMVKLCERHGENWDVLKHLVPATPPPTSPPPETPMLTLKKPPD